MRITRMYYGSYHVLDELPFTVDSLESAASKILYDDEISVYKWSVTISFVEKLGLWEVWFTRPATDVEYVEHMEDVPEMPGSV